MKVTVSSEDLSVEVEADGPYAPDVMADLCNRARDLLRLAHADQLHTDTEHEDPGE